MIYFHSDCHILVTGRKKNFWMNTEDIVIIVFVSLWIIGLITGYFLYIKKETGSFHISKITYILPNLTFAICFVFCKFIMNYDLKDFILEDIIMSLIIFIILFSPEKQKLSIKK